ncbi:MAG TPA: FliH/SctL family protein [Candidatus Methylomirabilis sp.]|nr:FliH/SctL family protein [Candidatus Methylomirabilis sp.]
MPPRGISPARTGLAVFPELSGRSGRRPASVETDGPDGAHAILRGAEQQAQALMEAARQKAGAAVEAGHREGRLQGHAEALSEYRERLRLLAAGLATAAARIATLEEEVRSQGAETVVRLALEVARRILGAEAAQDPAVVLRAVRTALQLLPEPGEVVVRIHPDQHAILQAHRGELCEAREGLTSLRFQADAAIEPGGCLVEAPGSLADATIAAQLEEAGRRLRDGLA